MSKGTEQKASASGDLEQIIAASKRSELQWQISSLTERNQLLVSHFAASELNRRKLAETHDRLLKEYEALRNLALRNEQLLEKSEAALGVKKWSATVEQVDNPTPVKPQENVAQTPPKTPSRVRKKTSVKR